MAEERSGSSPPRRPSTSEALINERAGLPAYLIGGLLVAATLFMLWTLLGKSGHEEDTEQTEVAEQQLEAVEAASLIAAGDKHPTLAKGDPPPTPNIDIALAPTIVCRILIDQEGKVTKASVYRPRLELALFEKEALAAIKTYQFVPGHKSGKPVPVWINWPVSFDNEAPPPSKSLQIKGSDTIGGALGPALAMAYSAVHSDVAVKVEALGSSTAFSGLFDGTAEIGASSRPVNAEELKEATKLGVELREFVIAYDGIAIIVHPDNPIESLTIEQAGKVFRGEIVNWKELGWFDLPIHRISRPSYSGTHGVFKKRVVGQDKKFAADTKFIESSVQLSRTVAADKNAIAYVGLGWVGAGVKTVPLADKDKEPAGPTNEAIREGQYPLFRPLMMYTRGTPGQRAADFLRFVVSPAGRGIIKDNGFVPNNAVTDIPSRPDADAQEDAPTIARVYFSAESARLNNEAKRELDAVAKSIKGEENLRVRVVGLADMGASGETLATAVERAEEVAERLAKRGVSKDNMDVSSDGHRRPISSNMTPAGRAANRRVDVFVTKAGLATADASPEQPAAEKLAVSGKAKPQNKAKQSNAPAKAAAKPKKEAAAKPKKEVAPATKAATKAQPKEPAQAAPAKAEESKAG